METQTPDQYSTKRFTDADIASEWPLYFLTSYSSNFIGRVASSESCYVGAEAVANQVDVLQRHVGGFLEATASLKQCFFDNRETYRILLSSGLIKIKIAFKIVHLYKL